MSTYDYTDISIAADKSVMLVDSWGDIQKQINIRPDQIVGFAANWSAHKHGQEISGAPHYHLRIFTTSCGPVEMWAPHTSHPTDDGGAWFADVLDHLDDLMMGATTC